MTLSFKKNWPKKMDIWSGAPTFFIEKIWASLPESVNGDSYHEYLSQHKEKFGQPWDGSDVYVLPKKHTLRHGTRWKPGDKIHFCINSRTKRYFQFAPVVEVKGVQEIQIEYQEDGGILVIIDGRHVVHAVEHLAKNDGFESIAQFFNWFDKDFKGQIVHWTNLKY